MTKVELDVKEFLLVCLNEDIAEELKQQIRDFMERIEQRSVVI